MDLTLVLGSMAVVGAIVTFWWGLTDRPSAARAHLVHGLPQPDAAPTPIVGMMRQLGDVTRRRLPNALVDGLDVNLVQAGHPGGMDLPRILGIKVTLASVGALLFVLNGKIIFAVIAAVILFFFPDYWVLSVRDKRRAEIRSAAADLID